MGIPVKLIYAAETTICQHQSTRFQHPFTCFATLVSGALNKLGPASGSGEKIRIIPPSFTAVTVSPALVLPMPVVITDR
jgi:hypothetical protein